MEFPSQEKLEEIVKRLSEILRIQNWDIKVKVVTGLEMSHTEGADDQTCGLADRDIRHSLATIYINHEVGADDWYYTLVHELCHVQSTLLIYEIDHLKGGDTEHIHTYYEQVTDNQAKTIISLLPVSTFIKDGEKS